jgi:uncharacterized protein
MGDADACPLPAGRTGGESDALVRMLCAKRIAVVGLSDDPHRPSYDVASYLRSAGKEVIPINPNHRSVMGLICYPSLAAVPGPIDLVDVFRRPEFCAEVAQEAVEVGAKGIWLQSGITNAEAGEIARKAGIDFIQNRCLKVELMFREG